MPSIALCSPITEKGRRSAKSCSRVARMRRFREFEVFVRPSLRRCSTNLLEGVLRLVKALGVLLRDLTESIGR